MPNNNEKPIEQKQDLLEDKSKNGKSLDKIVKAETLETTIPEAQKIRIPKEPSASDEIKTIESQLMKKVPATINGIKGRILKSSVVGLNEKNNYTSPFNTEYSDRMWGDITKYVTGKNLLNTGGIQLSEKSKINSDDVKDYITEHYAQTNKINMHKQLSDLAGKENKINADVITAFLGDPGMKIAQSVGNQYSLKLLSRIGENKFEPFKNHIVGLGSKMGVTVDQKNITDLYKAQEMYLAMLNMYQNEIQQKKQISHQLNTPPPQYQQ